MKITRNKNINNKTNERSKNNNSLVQAENRRLN